MEPTSVPLSRENQEIGLLGGPRRRLWIASSHAAVNEISQRVAADGVRIQVPLDEAPAH